MTGPLAPRLSRTSKRSPRSWRTGLGKAASAGTARTPAYRIYSSTAHKMVESWNIVFIETPSKVVSTPTNELKNFGEMGNTCSISIRAYDGMLQGVQLGATHRASSLETVRRTTTSFPLCKCTIREDHRQHPRTASADDNHRRAMPASSNRRQTVEANSTGDPLEGWPPAEGGRHVSIR